MNPITLIDVYKLGHRQQYPKGTTRVYSNWTPRESRIPGVTHVTHFGLQYFLDRYLGKRFGAFFASPVEEVCAKYERRVNGVLGPNTVGSEHIRALHKLQYVPLEFRALPEGTAVPLRVPAFTIENTIDEFFWLTNYIEDLVSCTLWKPSTSATSARVMRAMLDRKAKATGGSMEFVDWQGHDFSFRGMCGPDDAALSGAGHLLSFKGTDTIPALDLIEEYYGPIPADYLLGGSVPATEHSVMCAGGELSELETFSRLLDLYPTGIISVVSDTWDLWNVVANILPQLKERILARDGKLVIRPDCYDDKTEILTDSGWRLFRDLRKEDLVAQVDDEGYMGFVQPTAYIDQAYAGPMIRFRDKNDKVDLLVTPNHRMVWEMTSAQGGVHVRVHEAEKSKVANWGRRMFRSAPMRESDIALSDLDRLRIAFQADGSFQSRHSSTDDPGAITGMIALRFNFSKQRKVERLRALCDRGGFRYTSVNEPARAGQTTINVWVPRDSVPTKDLSWVPPIAELSSTWSREFIEELSHWDATRRSEERFKFDTTNESASRVVELVAMAAGYGVLITETADERSEKFSNVFTAHIMTDQMIGSQAIEKTVEQYDGRVYCVKVPTGKLVVKRARGTAVSGNSGDPSDILCGDPNAPVDSPPRKGLVQLLWEIFGGTETPTGHRLLDSHVGCIYGDAITYARGDEITDRLAAKGFASTNVVLGIGSFTYQYVTRDTFGFAMKATWCKVNGEGRDLFKSPKTGNGMKNSAKGRLAVLRGEDGELKLVSQATPQQESDSLLRPVWRDGAFLIRENFADIRNRVSMAR